jgi:hypothetical protein
MDDDRRAALEWLALLIRATRRNSFNVMRAHRPTAPGDFIETQRLPVAA